jgi:hypothetical protein
LRSTWLLVVVAVPETVESEFFEIFPAVTCRYPGQILIDAETKSDGTRRFIRHEVICSFDSESLCVRIAVNWRRILRKIRRLSMRKALKIPNNSWSDLQ